MFLGMKLFCQILICSSIITYLFNMFSTLKCKKMNSITSLLGWDKIEIDPISIFLLCRYSNHTCAQGRSLWLPWTGYRQRFDQKVFPIYQLPYLHVVKQNWNGWWTHWRRWWRETWGKTIWRDFFSLYFKVEKI